MNSALSLPETPSTGDLLSPQQFGGSWRIINHDFVRWRRVGDIAAWAGENGQHCNLVFSNAALQWVPDHAALFPKLFNRVAAGGALAIQMPGNYDAPALCIMQEMAASQASDQLIGLGKRNELFAVRLLPSKKMKVSIRIFQCSPLPRSKVPSS